MSVHHFQLDVEGALLNWPLKRFKGMFLDSKGGVMSPDEAKRHLLRLFGKGVKYLPFGNCEGFDPVTGCPGHPEDGEVTP
jgi:hypothetical protein